MIGGELVILLVSRFYALVSDLRGNTDFHLFSVLSLFAGCLGSCDALIVLLMNFFG